MKSVIAAATLLLSANLAMALEPPVYDSDHYCKAINAFTEILTTLPETFRDSLIKNCMELEERRAGQIKRIISDVDDATIKNCDTSAKALAGGSYQVFVGCLAGHITELILEGKLQVIRPPDK